MQHIIGQDYALGILKAALAADHMHHAWIFHGPTGVGKATTAKALAKILLCHSPQKDLTSTPVACDACESCTLFASSSAAHPDLHLIYKELAGDSQNPALRNKKQLNIPVDLLREHMVGGWVGGPDGRYHDPIASKSPMLRHGRVFIIDEAELLDQTGQNTLLKTLEEPPPNTYIILITSNLDRLLPTIRSRSQTIAFNPLAEDHVSQWLGDQPKAADLSSEQIAHVITFARGSIGKAQIALRYNFHLWYEQIVPYIRSIAQCKPAPQLGPLLAQLVEAFAKQWVDCHPNASKDAANKAGVRHAFGLMGELCRKGIHAVSKKSANHPPDITEQKLQPYLTGIQLMQEAESQLQSNVAIGLLLENLAIQWSSTPRARLVAS